MIYWINKRAVYVAAVLAFCVPGPWSSHGQEISPRLIAGQIGENVIINCTSPRLNEAENNQLQVYIPATNQIQLFESNRLDRTLDFGAVTTYRFGPLESSDNGTILLCSANQFNSANATIIVTFRPVIARTPESPQGDPLELRVGQAAVIRFNIMANPPPLSYSWKRDGVAVTNVSGLTFALDSITIDFVVEEFHGTYTLEVVNLAGSGFYNFTLYVLFPPRFVASYVSPSNTNCTEDGITFTCAVKPGASIEFLCGVTGNPIPTVTTSVGSGTSIMLDPVTVSNAGKYSCRASSSVFPQSTITRQFQLFVGGPPQSLNRVVVTINTRTQSVEVSWEYNNSRNAVPATNFILVIKQEGQNVITLSTTLSINQLSYNVSFSRLTSEEAYIVDLVVRNLQGGSEVISQHFTVPNSENASSASYYLLSLLFVIAMMMLY